MPLVFLPGLACDHRLLGPQRRAFPDLIVPPYIPAREGESVRDYAARLAASLPAGGPLHLAGISLGSIIAQEVARVLRPDALILLAAARDRSSFPRLGRLAEPLSRPLPLAVHHALIVAGSSVLARLDAPGRPDVRALLTDMARAADPAFTRWATRAVLD